MGKGEIARYEEFSFSHIVFKRLVSQGPQKASLCGNGLTPLKKKPFENIMGRGENAGNQHFLLFSEGFLPIRKRMSIIKLHLFCCLQMLSIWTILNICRLVKSYWCFLTESVDLIMLYRVFEKELQEKIVMCSDCCNIHIIESIL